MKQQYPKILFKTKEDNITVHSAAAEEKAAEEGYGDYDVVILGRKPQKEVEAENQEALEKKIEAEVTDKIRAEIKVEVTEEITAKMKGNFESVTEDYQRTIDNLYKKLEATEKNMAEVNKAFEKSQKELQKLKKEKVPAPA